MTIDGQGMLLEAFPVRMNNQLRTGADQWGIRLFKLKQNIAMASNDVDTV